MDIVSYKLWYEEQVDFYDFVIEISYIVLDLSPQRDAC